MHRDNWSDQNTSALITGISGIAGQLLNKNQGALTPEQQRVAQLAQQTANALAQAQQQEYIVEQKPGFLQSPTFIMVAGGIAFLIIGLFLSRKTK